MRTLHILMIVPGFPKDEEDSTCIPALQLYIKYLSLAAPYDVTIVSLSYPPFADPYQWNGLTIFPLHSGLIWPLSKIASWNRLRKLISVISKNKSIDLIHSFWLNDAALMGLLMSRKLKIPHLTTVMGQDVRSQNLYRYILPISIMRLVGLSSCQMKHLDAYKSTQYVLVPWGIDSHDRVVVSRSIDLIGVGSLTANKDYPTFVRLVHKLKDSYPDINAVIIGDGPHFGKLIEMIQQLDLESNIKVMGALPRSTVLDLMKRARILVHTSLFEGYGYIFSEALSCGCYIVSRPVGLACDVDMHKWKKARGEVEMLMELKLLLSEELDHTPVIINTMQETVAEYLKIYEALLH